MSLPPASDRSANGGALKSPRDFAGGLFLLAIAGVGYAGAFDLRFGHLSGIGSGLLPKSVAVLVAAFGVLLIAMSLSHPGEHLERWHLRGPVYVLGAVLAFALTIRGSTLSLAGLTLHIPQLGLAVAGPLSMIISAYADKETRFAEIIPFALVLTALSIGLFKFLLRLPIPIFPYGYGPF